VYLADCVQRLLLQYPEVDADPAKLQRLCAAALDGPEGSSTASYWATLLRSISRDLLPVSPAHYDLRGSDPAADFPDRGNGGTPPFVDFAMEEPPFVVPQPRRIPGKKDLAGRTLLLKSSSDCYRIWLLRALFPAARFKFVLLARNPAGAISGLIDGWLSDGFYSHNVGRFSALHVAGYSRPDRPWTERWWNFDLPPGWHDQRERSIQEACGHQWLSANQHIRSAVADGLIADRIEVQYESLLEAASLKSEISRIAEFAGLGPDPAAAAAAGPIMSVTPPAPQKWRKRRDALAPLVSGGPIAEMATRLGYDPAVWESWQ
jgi:hypothetical protein